MTVNHEDVIKAGFHVSYQMRWPKNCCANFFFDKNSCIFVKINKK